MRPLSNLSPAFWELSEVETSPCFALMALQTELSVLSRGALEVAMFLLTTPRRCLSPGTGVMARKYPCVCLPCKSRNQ